jgi:hypothetical protein
MSMTATTPMIATVNSISIRLKPTKLRSFVLFVGFISTLFRTFGRARSGSNRKGGLSPALSIVGS